jgi:MFS family permease
MIAPLAARALRHARRFPRPFWVLMLADALHGAGAGLFVPYWALYLTTERGASGAQAGALLALAGGVGLVGAPVGGLAADRIGRRPSLLIAGTGIGVGLILYGSLSSLVWIAVLTPFWAVMSDITSPAVSAAIADLVEPDLRAEAYGLRRQLHNMTFALGPPLGGLLVLALPMRWLFILAGLSALAATAAVAAGYPETRPERAAHEGPPRLRDAARDRRLLALAAGLGVVTMVYVQFDGVLGVFLHEERGYSLAAWGLVFGLNPILIGALQYPVARWAGRRSPRAMLALGALLMGLALFVLWPASPLVLLVAAVVVLTVGEMLQGPIGSTVAADLAPPHLRGSYEGIVDLAFAVSYAPAVLVGLWLVGAGHGEVMLAAALPLALVAAVCFLPVPRKPTGADPLAPVPVEAARPA